MAMNRFVGLGILALSSMAASFAACNDSTTAVATGGVTGSGGVITAAGGAAPATGGAVTAKGGAAPGVGGAAPATGGAAPATGGAGPATGVACGADIIAGRSTDATANWIGGDPAVATDNPCGIQGAIYAYGDTTGTLTTPALKAGSTTEYASPCAAAPGKCCIAGATKLWSDTSSYKEWGAGIGISLNDPGADASGAPGVKKAYAGTATKFAVTLSGTFGGQACRFQLTQSATDTAAPFTQTVCAAGATTVTIAGVTCPTWATTCTAGGKPYDLQIQIVGGDTAGAFNMCVDSVVPS